MENPTTIAIDLSKGVGMQWKLRPVLALGDQRFAFALRSACRPHPTPAPFADLRLRGYTREGLARSESTPAEKHSSQRCLIVDAPDVHFWQACGGGP
jgi:hypothetical protein